MSSQILQPLFRCSRHFYVRTHNFNVSNGKINGQSTFGLCAGRLAAGRSAAGRPRRSPSEPPSIKRRLLEEWKRRTLKLISALIDNGRSVLHLLCRGAPAAEDWTELIGSPAALSHARPPPRSRVPSPAAASASPSPVRPPTDYNRR